MRTPLALFAIALTTLSHAGSLLGIDNSGLYTIDTKTGKASLAASLTGHGKGDTNALAYDAATKKAYYQRESYLWSVDLSNAANPVFAKTAYQIGSVDDATFYGGAYYYGVGKELRKIDFSTTGYTVAKSFTKSWGYGDIAVTSTGKLYGSSGDTMYTTDLSVSGNAYATLAQKGHQMQLGFVNGALYGVANGNANAPTGALYTIDLMTGQQTRIMNGATAVTAMYEGKALAIRDAAGIDAVPEPTTVAALGLGALTVLRRRRRV